MKLNLSTEGLARASARRPWTTIGVWIVVIVAALGINVTLLADAMTTEFAFTNEPELSEATICWRSACEGRERHRRQWRSSRRP